MDIASLIGLIGTLGMIAGAMISSGGLGMFVDTPSMLIVFGGTFFAVMYRSTLPTFLSSFGTLVNVFMPIVTKLEHYSAHELLYRQMVVMGLKFISRGESPRNITDQLVANLPPKIQAQIEEAA